MTKIAILHSEFTAKGGAERKALLIARELNTTDEVRLICGNFDKDATFAEYIADTPIQSFPSRGPIGKLIALIQMARATKGAEVIIAHNHPAQLAAGLANRWYKIPVIWFCNEPLLYIGKHATPSLKIRILRRLEKWLTRPVAHVIANSQNTKRTIATTIGHTATVIYSGLDLSHYPTPTPKTPGHRLVSLGRIEEHKHFQDLVDIYRTVKKQIPEASLTIIGSGGYLAKLKQLAADTDIVFKQNLSEADKIVELQAAHLFLFPTKNEPLGVTSMEAQACGTPVVAYNSGGVKETVKHDQTGWLVDTQAEFIDTVVTQLKANGDYVANTTAHSQKNFSIAAMLTPLRQLMPTQSLIYIHRGRNEKSKQIGKHLTSQDYNFDYRGTSLFWLIFKAWITAKEIPKADVYVSEGALCFWVAMWLKLRYPNSKVILNIIEPAFYLDPNRSWVRRALFRWRMRLMDRIAIGLIAVSEMVKQDAAQFLTMPIRVAHHFMVDPKRFDTVTQTEQHLLFICERPRETGHIKGLKVAVEAYRQLRQTRPDIKLLLVGAGTESLQFDCEGIEYLGHQRIESVMARAAVLICPAIYDAFAIVVAEAIAAGVVPIVSDRVGAKALLSPFETELVVDGRDPAQYAMAIAALLDRHDRATLVARLRQNLSVMTYDACIADTDAAIAEFLS